MKISTLLSSKSILKNFGLYTIILFFAILSAIIPLSLDDYAWKSKVGINRMHHWFHDYNGRYLSNLLELAAVRSSIAQILIMTIFSSLLIIMLRQLTFRNTKSISYILILLIVMMLPIPLFAETFGWVAGYVNYVTSATTSMVFCYRYHHNFISGTCNTVFNHTCIMCEYFLFLQKKENKVSLFQFLNRTLYWGKYYVFKFGIPTSHCWKRSLPKCRKAYKYIRQY